MEKSNVALRLQPSLKQAAERLAAADGVSLNQFINVAVAEKIAALETERYFTARATRGTGAGITRYLDAAGHAPPAPGDEM